MATYDWADSAFAATVVAAVFPIYYQSVIGAGLPVDILLALKREDSRPPL